MQFLIYKTHDASEDEQMTQILHQICSSKKTDEKEESYQIYCVALSYYIYHLEKKKEDYVFGAFHPAIFFPEEIQLAKNAKKAMRPNNWNWEYKPRKLTRPISSR